MGNRHWNGTILLLLLVVVAGCKTRPPRSPRILGSQRPTVPMQAPPINSREPIAVPAGPVGTSVPAQPVVPVQPAYAVPAQPVAPAPAIAPPPSGPYQQPQQPGSDPLTTPELEQENYSTPVPNLSPPPEGSGNRRGFFDRFRRPATPLEQPPAPQ